MSDGTGRIFVATGNGVSPAAGPGNRRRASSPTRWSGSRSQPSGSLSAKDFFSPANAPSARRDRRATSAQAARSGCRSAPTLPAPAGAGGQGRPRVPAEPRQPRRPGAGRRGYRRVAQLRRPVPAGQWGHPAAFGDTTTVTTANAPVATISSTTSAAADYLRVLKLGLNGSDTPTLSDVANSPCVFGYRSGSPVVTSNGTYPSSAVVWEVRRPARRTKPARSRRSLRCRPRPARARHPAR